ncbi:MAG: hypothetical protein IKM34_03215 [Clostridia bacterium]|nr:hypothetical protein [Clostridia bacterium]
MNKQIFNKKRSYLIILLLAGIILLFVSNGFLNTKEKDETNNTPQEFELCEKRCEERVASILRQIIGIRDASVMVTLDQIPSNKERPHVRGVAVVCQGEETPDLRLRVVLLISSALGVTSDKIYVTFTS